MDTRNRVTVDVDDRVAVVTLNRPERRNALDSATIEELPRVVTDLGRRDDVEVIVLTGADPAFCAGLDLHELGSTGANLGLPDRPEYPWPWKVDVPVIGAINGPAIAGGFELSMFCDFLVASELAIFGDTHARVGQFPGAGLTVRLVETIGVARTRMLCLTGNFIDAQRAYEWGLVVDVVPHANLIAAARRLATDIVSNDRRTVGRMLPHLDAVARITRDPGLVLVEEEIATWNTDFSPADVASRREGILARSRAQRAAD
jgi:enoyl-CoA hydratase